MTSEEVLLSEFEKLKDEVVERYDQLGMRASGNFQQGMEVQGEGLTVRLLSEHYVDYLVDGRGPGKFPPIDIIEKWIEDKGIVSRIEGDISVSSLAFLIARKIAGGPYPENYKGDREGGTRYFKQGGTDLIDSVVTPERIQSIIDKVSVFNASIFTTRFTKLFQELAT